MKVEPFLLISESKDYARHYFAMRGPFGWVRDLENLEICSHKLMVASRVTNVNLTSHMSHLKSFRISFFRR
jgi:hypothetical protein